MKLESGLYMVNDIVEVSGPTRFEKCHFLDECEFVGSSHRVEFFGCTFENGVAVSARGLKNSHFEQCLFVSGPSKPEHVPSVVPA